MALTRANVEAITIRRVGKLLTATGLDGTTVDGSNADLSDPIAWAVKQCGGTVASRVLVASADVATVSTANEEKLLDLTELRALESAWHNYDDADSQVDDVSVKFDQVGKRLEKALTEKRADVKRLYGFGVISVAPYLGGQTLSDKESRASDTDRTPPAFTRNTFKEPGTAPENDSGEDGD